MKMCIQTYTRNAQTGVRVPIFEDLVLWVKCRGCRCMVSLEESGKWINSYTGEKMKDFVKVIG